MGHRADRLRGRPHLQLASSQFSPRVLPNFLSDRLTQATVGFFVYCLVALRSVGGPGHFVPRLTVTVAACLAAIALVLLVGFIHHMSTLIQVSLLERLADAAEEGAQLDVRVAPGHFVTPATVLVTVAPRGALDEGRARRAFLLAEERGVVVHARRRESSEYLEPLEEIARHAAAASRRIAGDRP